MSSSQTGPYIQELQEQAGWHTRTSAKTYTNELLQWKGLFHCGSTVLNQGDHIPDYCLLLMGFIQFELHSVACCHEYNYKILLLMRTYMRMEPKKSVPLEMEYEIRWSSSITPPFTSLSTK
ncbi:hypothetical protein TorRG33x02_068580 [Trema orientale]|uniref:Uncharacterized protein n=1 Tax=Trema orientale TaxID=63057 RepID=A0A2P5FHV4_TREOI|nr:hypothetical protein TorRG33x02_068580 [Trema orientale]